MLRTIRHLSQRRHQLMTVSALRRPLAAVILALVCLSAAPAFSFDINQNNRMIQQDHQDRQIRANADARQRAFENQLNRRSAAEKRADEKAAHALACAIIGCGPGKKQRRQAQSRPRDVDLSP